MIYIMARRIASSSYIAFARIAIANTAARIIAISWEANTRRAITFTASCYTSWRADTSKAMTYCTTSGRANIT